MRKGAVVLLLSFALLGGGVLAPCPVDAQTPQFVNKVSETLDFSGYIQVRWQYTDEKNVIPNNTFRIRRARFKIRPTLTARIKSTIEIDVVPTSVVLKDVFIDYLVSPKGYFTFRMGHWKKPFGREELRSSSALLMVDRGRLSEKFGPSRLAYQERDIGLAVLGDFYEAKVPFEYSFGVFNGSGANQATDADSRKSYVGRVEAIPVAGLSLGANFYVNDIGVSRASGRADTLGFPGNEDHVQAKAYGLDWKFQKKGFALEGEFRSGDNWRGGAIGSRASANLQGKRQVNQGIKIRGVYVTAVYKAPTHSKDLPFVEPGFRVEIYDPNTKVAKDGSTLYTPCLGFYFHEHARLQFNAVVEKPQDSAKKTITTFVAQLTVRY